MRRFVFVRYLALLLAMMLVPPPGWCCFSFCSPRVDVASTAESAAKSTKNVQSKLPPCCASNKACKNSSSQHLHFESDNDQCPSSPKSCECQCQSRDGFVPESAQLTDHSYSQPLAISFDIRLANSVVLLSGGIDSPPKPATIPLQILYCIWRC